MIEAAAKGASNAISLVANVAVMLITFFAFIAFFNAVLSFVGSAVGFPELSFQVRNITTTLLLPACLPVCLSSCSDEGLTLETSVHNHFHGVKLIYINLKLIHYTFILYADAG